MITVSWKIRKELKNRFLLSLWKIFSRDKRFFRHVILPPIFVLGFHSASRACWSQSFYCMTSFWLFFLKILFSLAMNLQWTIVSMYHFSERDSASLQSAPIPYHFGKVLFFMALSNLTACILYSNLLGILHYIRIISVILFFISSLYDDKLLQNLVFVFVIS